MRNIKKASALILVLIMFVSIFSIGASAWNTGNSIKVFWNGTLVGTISYDTMAAAISQDTDKTYAGINNWGTYKEYEGKVYTLDQLIAAVSKTSDWNNAPSTTTVTIQRSSTDTALFTKAQLTETRYYYDEDGVLVNSVVPGFMKLTDVEMGDYFKFVFGQTAKAEKNVPKFWNLDDFTTDAEVHINTNATPTQVGTIYAQVNGTGQVYGPNAVIPLHQGEVIHFNYSNSDYLNTTMIYYTWGDQNTTVSDPGVNDSSICYIIQAPMWGGDYAPFEYDGTYYWCTLKIIGVRYGCLDSDVFTYTVRMESGI